MPRPMNKAAERTAQRIVQDIADGELAAGDRLAPEASMLRTYEVSRGTLREALRLLEVQGLVVMKSGPTGGPMVGQPDPFYFGRMSTLFFRLLGATYEDVARALLAVDPLITGMAAERKDQSAASKLISTLATESCELATQSTNSGHAVRRMTDFHRIVRELAGNPVLALLSDALGSIFMEHIVAVSDAKGVLSHSHEDHVRIAEAIINGDSVTASSLSRSHMERLIDFHRKAVPGIFSKSVRWR